VGRSIYGLGLAYRTEVDDLSESSSAQVQRQAHGFEDGALWVIQGKTKSKVCIPLALRLDVAGLVLGEVVARCRILR